MTDKINRLAVFTGNPMAETAISERIGYTADYIDEYGLSLPDGSAPPDDWPCAIFKYEADMYRFDLRCVFDGLLQTEASCARYNLPAGTSSAIFMALEGAQGEVEGFCQALCGISGLTCYFVENTANGHIIEKIISPACTPLSPCVFINLMLDKID